MASTREDRVSALIPARNEAANIARAVRSVAAQPEVTEILVVDDHSEDGTTEILHSLRDEIPRLRTLRVGNPPPGWTGKSNALAAGAREATGNWLLFTDADTDHRAGSLAEVLERAHSQRADMISLSPGQETTTWWEKAVIPFAYTELARLFRFSEVNDPKSKAAAANGQYILIRRAAYDSIGGHEALHGEILEDVALARRLKSAGRRIAFLPGAQWVSTRMYRSLGDMWLGWRKNLYLLWGCSPPGVLAAFTRVWFLYVAPPIGCVLGFGAGAVGDGAGFAAFGLGCLAGAGLGRYLYSRALKRIGFAPEPANYLVPGAALFSLMLIDSMVAHRWLGSVSWKGREYSTNRSV
ncbi:MAG TPA: glycosyltransferase [Terriglobia bacterium]|nr:glycosyltransferase [Terriglobia bacterium]